MIWSIRTCRNADLGVFVVVQCRWSKTMCPNCGHQRAYCSSPRWYMRVEGHGGIMFTGENRRTRRKACPSATLSTTNPTRTDPGADPGVRQRLTVWATEGPDMWGMRIWRRWRIRCSSELWHHVGINVSETYTVSIFRARAYIFST
jgi:hypothetical protein